MPMDPNAYLTSQGWKGKGTALKQGHSTRPLATVVKKTMSGVGKDRDQAVPFWDNIFASAALQIKIASTTASPSPSGTSTPITLFPHLAAPTEPIPSSPSNSGLSVMAIANKEQARRRLYAGFFKGRVMTNESLQESDSKSSSSGPSSSSSTEPFKHTHANRPKNASQSRSLAEILEAQKKAEEAQAELLRKAERNERKRSRALKRAKKEAGRADRDAVGEGSEGKKRKEKKEKKRKHKDSEPDTTSSEENAKTTLPSSSSSSSSSKKRKADVLTETPDADSTPTTTPPIGISTSEKKGKKEKKDKEEKKEKKERKDKKRKEGKEGEDGEGKRDRKKSKHSKED